MMQKTDSKNRQTQNAPWWKDEVVYQIYPRSFQDSNDDGIGDLAGITSRLDELKKLGITMIWLCPVFASPMKDNGYDISDYRAINPEFGTMQDMDRLIEEAAKRDISLCMDLVLNHTSDKHEWFQKALADPHSRYRDYYIFKPGNKPINNWRSVFGGSVWQKVEGEDTHYFHSFTPEQPDLNWENPEVRQEMKEIIQFWIDKGIRAFRVDAINFIKKRDDYASLEADGPDGLVKCTKGTRNQPGLGAHLAFLRDEVFKPNNVMTVAETAGIRSDQFEDYIGSNGFFSMVFDFSWADFDVAGGDEWFTRKEWTIADLARRIESSQMNIQKFGTAANFIENHDQPRAATKYLLDQADNPKAVKTLAVLNLMLKGVPFIYQGQELGMRNFERTAQSQFNDPSSIDQLKRAREHGYSRDEALRLINLRSRDNARVPYPWNDDLYHGFSTVRPWLDEAQCAKTIQYEAQDNDPQSVLNFYRALIALREDERFHKLITEGKIEFVSVHVDVIAFRRFTNDQSMLVLCSFTDREIELAAQLRGTVLLSNDTNRMSAQDSHEQTPEQIIIRLEDREALILLEETDPDHEQ